MKKMRSTILGLTLLAVVFAAAGCGNDRNESTAGSTQNPTMSESAPAGSTAAESTAAESAGTESMAPETAGMTETNAGDTGTDMDLTDGLDQMGDDISHAADDLIDDLTEGMTGTDSGR